MVFERDLHDCYPATDPRINKELQTSLRGKNIVIAGAGRGIGRACAEFLVRTSCKAILLLALEQSELGETAVICQKISPDAAVETAGADVTDYESVSQPIEKFARTYGGVHVLLMNAGRPPQWLSIAESDPMIWWDTVAISLQGAFNCSRIVIPIMRKQKYGRIIFTSSDGAHFNFGMSGYVMGKLGQVRLSEIIHVENNKEYNIHAFSINPGAIKTRFFTDFEDKVKGRQLREGGYVNDKIEHDDKSASVAYNLLKDKTWDTPYMAAGLITTLASGKLDFMSGRYLDSATNIQDYLDMRDEILKKDWHTVRLRYNDEIFPTLDRHSKAIA